MKLIEPLGIGTILSLSPLPNTLNLPVSKSTRLIVNEVTSDILSPQQYINSNNVCCILSVGLSSSNEFINSAISSSVQYTGNAFTSLCTSRLTLGSLSLNINDKK